MVGKDGPSDYSKPSDSGAGAGTDISRQQKGSIVDWVSLRPRAVSEEEKQHWVCIFSFVLCCFLLVYGQDACIFIKLDHKKISIWCPGLRLFS
jgi:hypothetical protein